MQPLNSKPIAHGYRLPEAARRLPHICLFFCELFRWLKCERHTDRNLLFGRIHAHVRSDRDRHRRARYPAQVAVLADLDSLLVIRADRRDQADF